jgi:hypothetical protein
MTKDKMEELVLEKPVPTSIPDLFSLINDENFGITETEDKVSKDIPRESEISAPIPKKEKISDSQRLALSENKFQSQIPENQQNKIKRIVWFYENGKFESFEP